VVCLAREWPVQEVNVEVEGEVPLLSGRCKEPHGYERYDAAGKE
jgi:hypothetical protein